MKLKDVQVDKEKTIIVTARLPKDYKKFIDENKINLRKLIMLAIEELKTTGRKNE